MAAEAPARKGGYRDGDERSARDLPRGEAARQNGDAEAGEREVGHPTPRQCHVSDAPSR